MSSYARYEGRNRQAGRYRHAGIGEMRPSTTIVMALLLLAILIAAGVQFAFMGNSSDATTTTAALESLRETLAVKGTLKFR